MLPICRTANDDILMAKGLYFKNNLHNGNYYLLAKGCAHPLKTKGQASERILPTYFQTTHGQAKKDGT